MPIEVEFHELTGSIGGAGDALFQLKHKPLVGASGEHRILVDPTHGPSQRPGVDWELVGANTDQISYNSPGSSIREVREAFIEEQGVSSVGPVVRVIYSY